LLGIDEVSLLTNMSINTKQGKISGDKVSTGNKCFITDKLPSINTEQGKISGDKGSTGNKNYILNICHLKFDLGLY
jgi:hypothetical protein